MWKATLIFLAMLSISGCVRREYIVVHSIPTECSEPVRTMEIKDCDEPTTITTWPPVTTTQPVILCGCGSADDAECWKACAVVDDGTWIN